MKYKKRVLPVAFLMALTAWGHGSHAQTSDKVAAPTQGLQEIVITAQRRNENLQNVPLAVSAVTSDDLASRGVSSASTLTELIPSVSFGEGGGGSNQVAIRGVGALAGNSLAEQVVAFNIDGTYLARTGSVSGIYFDLNRIEVVKGPQGTLYGRNATAGAVNVITNKPTLDKFGGSVSVAVGNYGLKQADAAVNVPLSDTVAARFAVQNVDRRGYLSDGYSDEKHMGARASILANLSEKLSVSITTDYTHIGGKGSAGVPSPYIDSSNPYIGPSDPRAAKVWNVATIPIGPFGTPPFVQGQSQPKPDGFLDLDNSSIYGSIDYDTGIGKLTIIPSYRKSKGDYVHYSAGFKVIDTESFTSKSFEARFSTPDQYALRAVIGAYYFNETGQFNLKFSATDLLTPLTENRVDHAPTTAKAIFGQATFDLTPTVRLIAGARSSTETKSFDGSVFNTAFSGDQKFTKTTWKTGIEFDLGKQSMAYFTVGTGFKAGGFYVASAPNTFKPENIMAWTLGSKNRFLENRLQLNAEAFYWNYKDKQVSHLGPVNPNPAQLLNLITENAGSAKLYGLELESRYLVTDNDLFVASLQYEHSEYKSYVYQQTLLAGPPLTSCKVGAPNAQFFVTVDCSGNETAQTPKWSLALTYNHTMPLDSGADLVFSASASAKSSYWTSEEHIVGQKQPGFGKLNLSATYNAKSDWSVTAYVDNVTDKAVQGTSFVDPIIATPIVVVQPPRTYGVRANLRF